MLAALFAVFTTTTAASIAETTASAVTASANVDTSQDENACAFCPPKKNTAKPPQQCEAGRKYDTRQGRCVRLPK